MAMHVNPIPTLDDRINDIRMRTAKIVNEDILPNENKLWAYHRGGEVTDRQRACGRLICRRSTAGWVWTSSPTRT